MIKLPIDQTYALRNFRSDDKSRLVMLGNNARVSAHLRDGFPFPYTDEAADFWLQTVLNKNHDNIFAITEDDLLIGGCGIHPLEDVYRFSAEVGYWLGEPYWSKGITTRALKVLVAFAFTTTALQKIFAGVFSNNPASERVLIKNGFTLEGRLRNAVVKRGETLDELRYGLLRSEWANAVELED